MKKVVVLLLTIAMLTVLLAGCGGNAAPQTSGATSPAPGTASPAPGTASPAPGTTSPAPGTASQAPESPTKPDKVYELTLSHQWSVNSFPHTDIVMRWVEDVKAATNGGVIIEVHPGSTLTSSRENYEGVVQGISDIGIVPYNNAPGRFPAVEAFALPGISAFNNAAAAAYALNEYIKTYNPEELSDTQHLWSTSTGASALITNKRIVSMEDMRGVPLGVTQAERARMLDLLGGTPISLTVPEFYEAMSKNLIAGAITSPETLQGNMLADVTGDYILNSPLFGCTMFYCVMNKDVFNSLPVEYQNVLLEVPDYAAKAWDELAVFGIEFAKKQRDVEINLLTPEETARWQEKMAPMLEDNIKYLNERGIDGEQHHKIIKELEAKYNALYPYSLRDRFN